MPGYYSPSQKTHSGNFNKLDWFQSTNYPNEAIGFPKQYNSEY